MSQPSLMRIEYNSVQDWTNNAKNVVIDEAGDERANGFYERVHGVYNNTPWFFNMKTRTSLFKQVSGYWAIFHNDKKQILYLATLPSDMPLANGWQCGSVTQGTITPKLHYVTK